MTALRVAVVDDIPLIRRGRAGELAAQGLSICGLYSFPEARAAVGEGRFDRAFLDAVVLDAHDNEPANLPERCSLAGLDMARLIRGRGGDNALTLAAARAAGRPGAQLTLMMVTQVYDEVSSLAHQFEEAGGDIVWPSAWDIDHHLMAVALADPGAFTREQLKRKDNAVQALRRQGLADTASLRRLTAARLDLETAGLAALARRYSLGDAGVRDRLNRQLRAWATRHAVDMDGVTARQAYAWMRATLLGPERAPSGRVLGMRLPPVRVVDRRTRRDRAHPDDVHR